jgi:hypothetical protein
MRTALEANLDLPLKVGIGQVRSGLCGERERVNRLGGSRMDTYMYSGNDLEARLPDALRPFIAIESLPLPEPIFQIAAQALQTASECLAAVAWVRRRAHMVFATAPFRLELSSGQLSYTPNQDVIHAHIEDNIFIDVNKLLALPFPLQVATILEELVHVFLNISDEELVSVVVAKIYEGICWVDGKYVLPNNQALAE